MLGTLLYILIFPELKALALLLPDEQVGFARLEWACVTYAPAYTTRDMTYDSDALNAFLGVMNSWSMKLSSGIWRHTHVWGVTISKD
jgi:hypothetical protein